MYKLFLFSSEIDLFKVYIKAKLEEVFSNNFFKL